MVTKPASFGVALAVIAIGIVARAAWASRGTKVEGRGQRVALGALRVEGSG
jgi:hypothetical protein